MPDAIGLLELSSIADGYEVEDTMLKAANVELIVARTICAGKYLVVVGGDTAACAASVDAGRTVSPDSVIEHRVIPNLHPQVFPAISGVVVLEPEMVGALGIVETFSAGSVIEAADAAAKAADVTLFRIHLAMAIGGKGFLQVTGAVAAVESAVDAAAAVAADIGLLVNRVVIPRPRPDLFREYI